MRPPAARGSRDLAVPGSPDPAHGFTLVELLVVIAIVTILAAILYPVLAHARSKAHQATCANNIEQLTMAALEYAEDWDGRLPGYNAFVRDGSVDGDVRTGTLFKYARSVRIYTCPVDPLCRGKTKHPLWSKGVGKTSLSYTPNINIWDGKLAEDPRPASRIAVLVEQNNDVSFGPGGDQPHYPIIDHLMFCWSDVVAMRHGRGGHISCADGHVLLAPGGWMYGRAKWANGTAVF